ncbi:MAG TPA: hypothetical protein VHD83_11535 [Puia sp.]|nr:hypothetical protein [Puia sp.]
MYKRRLFLAICLSLGIIALQAQISMTLQVPPAGVLVKNQLWNMLLVNSGASSLTVRVQLTLLDEKNNQPVLTAVSAPLMLSHGARQVQAKDLGPIQYNYSGPSFHADEDPNGLLPVGSYQACYTVVAPEKGNVLRAENCIQVNVDPLSPPLLNTPSDEARLFTTYPQFTWLPPTPVGLFNDLSYDLIVVEVLPGQGKADAIQQNIPIYSVGFVKDLYSNYPSSYRALDTSHLYAWRIVALNNGLPAAMSDVWTFRVTTPPVPGLKQREQPYIELKRGLDPSVASVGTSLKFTYENRTADSAVAYTIVSLEDPGNPVVQQGRLSLSRGRNFLELTLTGGGYAARKAYLFSMVNGRNETWTIKFTSSSTEKK